MVRTIIDLRSDTVTRPSTAMRTAIADADVGDDVFLEDPTINRLQERAAQIFRHLGQIFLIVLRQDDFENSRPVCRQHAR